MEDQLILKAVELCGQDWRVVKETGRSWAKKGKFITIATLAIKHAQSSSKVCRSLSQQSKGHISTTENFVYEVGVFSVPLKWEDLKNLGTFPTLCIKTNHIKSMALNICALPQNAKCQA